VNAQTVALPAATSQVAVSGPSIPFSRLVRVEWRKSTDTRASRWLLAASMLVAVAVLAIPIVWDDELAQTWSSYLQFNALPLAVLLPVVSILTMTSEWTQRSVLVTFTQEPRRGRVFGAKVTVGMALALAGAGFGMATSATALGISEALGRPTDFDPSAKMLAGFVVFLLLNSALGLAFAAVLHNSAAAIVMFFLLPTLWTVLSIGVFEKIGRWLDTTQTFGWVLAGSWDGHTGPILTSTAVWVALPLATGAARTLRREVK